MRELMLNIHFRTVYACVLHLQGEGQHYRSCRGNRIVGQVQTRQCIVLSERNRQCLPAENDTRHHDKKNAGKLEHLHETQALVTSSRGARTMRGQGVWSAAVCFNR